MSIRKAAVAGIFYPDDPSELRHMLGILLAERPSIEGVKSVAAVVPHAGYIYSGSTAAQAFKYLNLDQFDCILLLGPAHRAAVEGMALSTHKEFETPLGMYPLQIDLIKAIHQSGLGKYNDQAHLQEHSLEVQVPFLQALKISTPLVPVVVGYETPERVAELINYVTTQCRAFVMISSDLSHFHSYEDACLIDQKTSDRIVNLETNIQPNEACGCMALNGLLLWLKQTGKKIRLLSQCNSGDTAGDKKRVVGYGAYIVDQ